MSLDWWGLGLAQCASPLTLGLVLYIYRVCQCFFFIFFLNIFLMVDFLPAVSQKLMDRSSPKISVSIYQRMLPWQPISRKIGIFRGPTSFVALPLWNGLQYRNSDFKILNRMNFSTLCSIIVTFGRETPEFLLLTITPFVAIWQKSAYYVKYLRISWTYITDLVRVLVEMIIPILIWQSPKGHCHGNQLNLRDVCRWRQKRPLLVALAFGNGLADHEATFKRLNGNNLATLCKNLYVLLKRAYFAVIQPQFDDNLYSSHWRSKKQIGRSQFLFQHISRQSFLYIL